VKQAFGAIELAAYAYQQRQPINELLSS